MSVARAVTIRDAEELEARLMSMNEAGVDPNIPFIDADGIANMAMGQAPSGDDWQIGFVLQEPDSGMLAHCCFCVECEPGKCDLNRDWEPTYPLVALVPAGAS